MLISDNSRVRKNYFLNQELPCESNMDTLSQSDPVSANVDLSQVLNTPTAEHFILQQKSQLGIPSSQMATPPLPPQFLSQPLMSANMGSHMSAMYMPNTSPMNMNFPQQMLRW